MCELAARRLKRAEENDDVLRAVRELLYQRHKQLGAAEQQLAEARQRIAELEKLVDQSTVHRISLLPTYPEHKEATE